MKKISEDLPQFLLLVGFLMVMIMAAAHVKARTAPIIIVDTPQVKCEVCHNRQMGFELYFEKKGSLDPKAMAAAVLATKSPKLLAAVHVGGEKCTPHTIRKGGYRGRHAGAWQVNQRLHGRVSADPTAQALQAEKLLLKLTEEMPIGKALSSYGGDSTSKYKNDVFAELIQTP